MCQLSLYRHLTETDVCDRNVSLRAAAFADAENNMSGLLSSAVNPPFCYKIRKLVI